MVRRCCLYEKGTEEKYVCTSDPKCPQLTGWTLVGSWSVETCDDCFRGEDGQELTQIDPDMRRKFYEWEKAYIIMQWILEHWDEVFPDLGPKIEGFDKIEPILKDFRR